MRVFLQEENVLPHDEAPDRVIDRCVVVVALIDGELQKMFWKRGDCRIIQGNGVVTHEKKRRWPVDV